MFGYVQYDRPYLYVKDMELYKAMYCGTCKGIGASCGSLARLSLSYDVTFINVLLHNLKGVDVEIKKQSCFKKGLKKQPMAVVDDLTLAVGAFNTVLAYYKLCDDVADEKKGGIRRAFLSGAFHRAEKKYPELVKIVERFMRDQATLEGKNTESVDMAAEPTACMLRDVSRLLLEETATEHSDGLFYDLGKWIYLIDAVDDYDKDVKKKNYNPFYLSYRAESKTALVKEKEEELRFIFDTLFFDIRERMANLQFRFNRDLTDNVLLRGLPAKTEQVIFKRKDEKEKGKDE